MEEQLEPWVQSLLLGANSLEGLSICMIRTPCPPVMSRLKALRLLKISGWGDKPWLRSFFIDLAYCSTLETLVIGDPEHVESRVRSNCLPDMSLCDMPNLRHVELNDWIPGGTFLLPRDCKLLLNAVVEDHDIWEKQWESIRSSATVLCLG